MGATRRDDGQTATVVVLCCCGGRCCAPSRCVSVAQAALPALLRQPLCLTAGSSKVAAQYLGSCKSLGSCATAQRLTGCASRVSADALLTLCEAAPWARESGVITYESGIPSGYTHPDTVVVKTQRSPGGAARPGLRGGLCSARPPPVASDRIRDLPAVSTPMAPLAPPQRPSTAARQAPAPRRSAR